VGKPEGKGTLGRPRRWWVGNVKMDLTLETLSCKPSNFRERVRKVISDTEMQ
jgi:hypothetical protein